MSRDAVANTRPRLEIYADDVKCTHGATVGELDETAIFYLRTRGIPEAQARRMLSAAFAAELIDEITLEPLQKLIGELFVTALPGAVAGEGDR